MHLESGQLDHISMAYTSHSDEDCVVGSGYLQWLLQIYRRQGNVLLIWERNCALKPLFSEPETSMLVWDLGDMRWGWRDGYRVQKTGEIGHEFREETSGVEITNPVVMWEFLGVLLLWQWQPTFLRCKMEPQCTSALYQMTQSSINQHSGFYADISAEAQIPGLFVTVANTQITVCCSTDKRRILTGHLCDQVTVVSRKGHRGSPMPCAGYIRRWTTNQECCPPLLVSLLVAWKSDWLGARVSATVVPWPPHVLPGRSRLTLCLESQEKHRCPFII